MHARIVSLKNGLVLFALIAVFAARARANVAVLLEEPYSYDGALAGTGHAAVYLPRVCAETPVKLRLCGVDERGVVISRYHHIAGYDWIAIPLVPYLYAVEDPDEVPLYADPKIEAFLRDQYRRAHLEAFAPDGPEGQAPKGDWYELVGSSYDRTNYGFEIETTLEQDRAFIEWMNSRPNRDKYEFVSRNCADFVRDVLNFYYQKSEPRGNIADLFVSTPKHAAKSLLRYSRRHPDLEFTHFVIPQVPGMVRRSRPVRGVLESVVRAKKYMLALGAFHPFVAGGAVSVFLIGDRFNPARNAKVFNVDGELEPAPTAAEKRAYFKRLRTISDGPAKNNNSASEARWKGFLTKATPELDSQGQAVLEAPSGRSTIEIGVTRAGLAQDDASLDLREDLLLARLKQDLSRSRAPRISSPELRQDWQLLDRIVGARQAQREGAAERSQVASQSTSRTSD